VLRCESCGLVQTKAPIDSDEIYREEDYLYFSGEMPGLSDYFLEYKNELELLLPKWGFVVEIGSNDGTMLKHFKSHLVLGVDPAKNVVTRALANGVPTLSAGFDERTAGSIAREFGKADLIYGNNCIAHIDDLHSVMRGVHVLLKNDGHFVVECNYWGAMAKDANYSLVYHDHFSYFTVKDWMNLATEYGMFVSDAWVTPAQGGSLRVTLSNQAESATTRLTELIESEKEIDYKSYESRADVRAKKLYDKVVAHKNEGKTVAGYGAAAKGFSILARAGLDERHISYFVDDSPAKQGKFTPVSHIPVYKRDEKPDPDVFIITAPNYADIIKAKEKAFEGEFIVP